MSTIDNLRNRKITTVGQLIEELQKYDPSTKVVANGADSGGYDICKGNHCSISISGIDEICISHLVHTARIACDNKDITFEEYKEFDIF